MGDVAASGGYLAAMRADVIVAQPTTITGSIGVFGMWPVAADLLASLGIKVERLGVGTNAGMYSTFQPPTPAQRAVIGRELDAIYADFTRQVGEARKLDAGRLDAAARGRVFTGVDAKRAGLVDELGGLPLALSIAKAKAGIDESRDRRCPPLPGRERPLAAHRRPRAAPGRHRRDGSPGARAARGARGAGPLRHRRAARQRPPAAPAAALALTPLVEQAEHRLPHLPGVGGAGGVELDVADIVDQEQRHARLGSGNRQALAFAVGHHGIVAAVHQDQVAAQLARS